MATTPAAAIRQKSPEKRELESRKTSSKGESIVVGMENTAKRSKLLPKTYEEAAEER